MNILIKRYKGKYYVWKPATWRNGVYLVNGEQIDIFNILAVTEDDRGNYVRCTHCDTLIENTPEAIEAHFAEKEAQRNCLKCGNLRPIGTKVNQRITYTKNADGTYALNDTYTTRLGCTVGYPTRDIESRDAINNCIFSRCRRAGVAPINDVFIKYPNTFNKMITVDMLEEKKFAKDGRNGNYIEYDLKMRGTLKACVNDFGIVEKFKISIRGWTHNIYYSDTHNKLFYEDWGNYNDCMTDIMTAAKEEQILKKLASLYEEAQVDE